MAWTYSDWRSQTTTAARRTRLALYIAEIEDRIRDSPQSVNKDGAGLTRNPLDGLLAGAKADYEALPAETGGLFKIRRGTGYAGAPVNED